MAKTFLISTVAAGTVTLNDLGARAFTHPVVSLDLALEYSLEEIRESTDLRAAIQAGDLTAVFDSESITTAILFDKFVVDFNNVMVEDHETRIGTLEGDSHVQNTDTKLAEGTADEVTANELRLFVDSKGGPNGLATLDGTGKVPTSQLPTKMMEFEGNWDASTNTPTLANTDTLKQGTVYKNIADGTVNFGAGNISFKSGDWVFNNGTIWDKSDNTDAVTSVNTQVGAVVLDAGDLNYTQADPTDWTVADGSTIEATLDEVGSRLYTLETAPPVIKKSFTYSAGENGSLNGSRDLRRTNTIPTNISPFVVPIASTVWGISIASKQGVNKSYQVQVLVNGSAVITKTVTTTDKLFTNTETQALVAGDEVRIRFVKTTDNIDDLGVELYCVES